MLGSRQDTQSRESEGLQRTSWGGDLGAVSLQILKQDIKLWSLLCEAGHTLHSPRLPASSEVSQPLNAEFLILRAADILGWIILFGGVLSCAYHRPFSSIPVLYLLERQYHPLPSARIAILTAK